MSDAHFRAAVPSFALTGQRRTTSHFRLAHSNPDSGVGNGPAAGLQRTRTHHTPHTPSHALAQPISALNTTQKPSRANPQFQLQKITFPDVLHRNKSLKCQPTQIHIFSYMMLLQSHVMGTSILLLHIDTRQREMTAQCNIATPLTASQQYRSDNLRSRM
jgi:hypothetical protein